MSLPPCTKRPKTPKQLDRVSRILQAARHAFAQNSFHEVLVDDVARQAGVGKGTIYRYFPDKESLYFAVIFDGIDNLKTQIRTALPEQGSPEAAIRNLINILSNFLRQNRFFFRLMNVEDSKVGGEDKPNRRKWYQERSKLVDEVAALLERARDTGALYIAYPRTDAQILLGMVRAVLRYNEDHLNIQQMSDEIARIYLYGLRHR